MSDEDVLSAVLALSVTETRRISREERAAIHWAKQLLARELRNEDAD